KPELLDAPGEWFYASGELSLWTPDGSSPAQHTVEARSARDFAFDLSGRGDIVLDGLGIFAARLMSDPSTHDCVLAHLDVRYVSHFLSTTTTETPRETRVMTTGLVLDGTHNVLRDSTIAFSAGNGVLLQGDSNLITRNRIHDVNYAGTECAAI